MTNNSATSFTQKPCSPVTTTFFPSTNQYSTDKIIISDHAMLRIKERTDYSQKNNIRRFVTDARYKGINVNNLNNSNCELYGTTPKILSYVKSHFRTSNNSNKIILYKNSIFVFSGKKSRTLVTVVNLDKENIA